MPPSSPSFTPSFQIIVVPPAEDLEPDYLVFDAQDVPEAELLATEPDFPSLDAALARIRHGESPPTFTRTSVDGVVMPRARPQPELADETVRDDEEIVEVVKVRRAFSPDEPPPPPPKPKSLRSRAGSAFRSIKNLARVASRSTRPYAQEVFASSQSTQATFASVPCQQRPQLALVAAPLSSPSSSAPPLPPWTHPRPSISSPANPIPTTKTTTRTGTAWFPAVHPPPRRRAPSPPPSTAASPSSASAKDVQLPPGPSPRQPCPAGPPCPPPPLRSPRHPQRSHIPVLRQAQRTPTTIRTAPLARCDLTRSTSSPCPLMRIIF
ncbi:hypothetical protein B0H12DRAFT_1089514, partial [Mycena haematopus]